MGRKDDYQYDYLDDNERFADQINGALFHGVQVVKPDELEPADAQNVYLGKEDGRRENYRTVADVRIPERYKTPEPEKEGYDMCKAFEDYRLEGKEEGRTEGKIEGKIEGKAEQLIEFVCRKLRKNKTAEMIAEELEEELPVIERIIEAQQKTGNYDAEQIRKVCGAVLQVS